MEEDLLCSPRFKQQATASINAFTTAIYTKMDLLKSAFREGKITEAQLGLGRSKLLREAADTLHATITDPFLALEYLESASRIQQRQLITFSAEDYISIP